MATQFSKAGTASSPAQKRGAKKAKVQEGTLVIDCAFCRGRGTDPFALLSPKALCQVCGGSGKTEVQEPHAACAFCQGTGVHPRNRLSCPACQGKGNIHYHATNKRCPGCMGTGTTVESKLVCLICQGTGLARQ